MSAVGVMAMPLEFRYRDVFLRGKPQHDPYDPFFIKHPKMNTGRRAKIFSPFDALKGFSESVAAKNVLYRDRICLNKGARMELNRRLDILHGLTYNGRMARKNRVIVTISFFVPCVDEDNDAFGFGGQYLTVTGICWRVDPEITHSILVDKRTIPFDDILKIESPNGIFEEIGEIGTWNGEGEEYCD